MTHDQETGHYHPRLKKINMIAVTSEPDGQYRYHFIPPEPHSGHKPAYMEAEQLVSWMNQQ